MTAVIYARYSTDSQREESIEGQIRECTAYAEKNDLTVVKHYIDRAISAKTDNRPQFQQMIKDSERGIFDVIIVWKLDRFARNRYDSARYKTQLKRNGVKLVSATEVISAGPEGIILESVLEGYAEYYSADLSEKVVRGMTENTLKGVYNGGTVPFGYVIDENRHYKPDPLLAPYVEQAFQKYADGATMTDLRDWLKAHNIKNTLGGEMSYNTIQRMLSNRRYIGELRLRDVVQPNAIPALVSEELFNKVQEKLAKNKKAPARHKAEDTYLLTTKLYCGKCGALMFGESGVSHTGKMYTYYKCAAAKKKKTCDKKAVRKQWLEDLVVNETMKLVEDDASMNAIIAKVMELQNQESTDLPIYEKQLKETEVGITNMLNAIQMGILTSSTKERLEALEDQRKELQARIAEERLAQADLILAVFDTTRPLDDDDRRMLEQLPEKPVIAILNKSDQSAQLDTDELEPHFSRVITMAAREGSGLEQLQQAVEELFYQAEVTPELGIVANARQKQCLEQAREQVQLALEALDAGELLDAVTVLLEEAANALLTLTGERVSEAVVNDVFSRFCVGK